MSLSLTIARRYLFSRKSHSAINIISAISALGIAFSTMALVCVLSVFNGFHDLIGGLYSAFDPQLELTPARGKLADAADPALERVRRLPVVAAASASLEENALILYKGNPLVVTLKGVDAGFGRVSGVDSIVFNADNAHVPLPGLSAAGVNYAVPGYGLAARMGLDFGHIQICAPRRGERINMANPAESFNVDDIFSQGLFFQVSQKRYDESHLLVSLAFAQHLFEQEGRISALGLRLKEGVDPQQARRLVEQAAGGAFVVRDRTEQHGEMFRMMAVEKLVAFSFLTFILLIACFNLVGSVSMLIIDKREGVATLRSLGLDDRGVARVFLLESRLITLIGATAGVALGLLLCWLQTELGLLSLGGEGVNFIVEAYPVSVHWTDIALVFLTVVAIGFAVVWLPVRYLSRRVA